MRVDDTHEQAVENVRNGHDEFWKFLGPYGWSRGYMGEDGRPAPPGLIPTLDESLENKTILVGTPADVAAEIGPGLAKATVAAVVASTLVRPSPSRISTSRGRWRSCRTASGG